MGMTKVKVLEPGKVKIVHQLDNNGEVYAEDVLITSDVPGRLSYLESQDGKIGVFTWGFSESTVPSDIRFPDED